MNRSRPNPDADSFAAHAGFGCVALTAEPTVGRALRILEAAYEAGIRHFDTAPGYGAGYSERILGRFIQGRRETVTIATKIGSGRAVSRLPANLALPLNAVRHLCAGRRAVSVRNPAPPLLAPRVISKATVQSSVEQSLRSLRTGRIDVLLLHEALPAFLDEAATGYLHELRTRGVVGALGVAAHGSNYLVLPEGALEGWDVLQYEYGADWPAHAELPKRFPGMRHILHSCLGQTRVADNNPGSHLASAAKAVPGSTVLFSSRNPRHIQANIRDGETRWRAQACR
jgi:D-threo-aldose 1-dehydrogenase